MKEPDGLHDVVVEEWLLSHLTLQKVFQQDHQVAPIVAHNILLLRRSDRRICINYIIKIKKVNKLNVIYKKAPLLSAIRMDSHWGEEG